MPSVVNTVTRAQSRSNPKTSLLSTRRNQDGERAKGLRWTED